MTIANLFHALPLLPGGNTGAIDRPTASYFERK
jgi:hypothetical protein